MLVAQALYSAFRLEGIGARSRGQSSFNSNKVSWLDVAAFRVSSSCRSNSHRPCQLNARPSRIEYPAFAWRDFVLAYGSSTASTVSLRAYSATAIL